MNKTHHKQASRYALSDIAKYQTESNIKMIGENRDILVVTPNQLETKENRRLNKELGIHKINKQNAST